MLKKLAITAAAGAIMLSSAAGVFAFTGNWAHVTTNTTSVANTGNNVMGMGGDHNFGMSGNGVAVDSNLQTGNANTHTFVVTAANTNLGGGTSFNGAKVKTNTDSEANSGGNGFGVGGSHNGFLSGNGVSVDGQMYTGNANTHTTVVTVVNTNVHSW